MKVIPLGIFSELHWDADVIRLARRLYAEDESFSIICGDYWKCRQALNHWNQSRVKEASYRVAEYSDLLQEIAEELGQYLGVGPDEVQRPELHATNATPSGTQTR